jgi:glycosyltransferase involved in cell wall biosynthesis
MNLSRNHFRQHRPLFVSTYTPQKCGIATFTRDLAESVSAHLTESSVGIAAISEDPRGYDYPPEVVVKLKKQHRPSYSAVAEFLNFSEYDTVCVQHEFGIFGGNEGSYLLDLLRSVRKPVVTTLHTVLAQPADHYRERLCQVVEASDAVVVLTPRAMRILGDVYKVPVEKVRVIPHGIPDVPFVETPPYKRRFGAEGRTILMTFGLIGPSKGIEDMIEAMPAIVARNPDVLYIIVGATHPGVIMNEGEAYRERLERRVAELGLEGNIRFENRYLTNDDLNSYLKACDIYVTPYPTREQISSGTLAYATGMGKAVVSTPYYYAEDLLADGRGRFAEFRSPESLAATINDLIADNRGRHEMRRRAYEFGRRMVWRSVGQEYLRLFEEVAIPRFSRLWSFNWKLLQQAKQNSMTVAQQRLLQQAATRASYGHQATGK